MTLSLSVMLTERRTHISVKLHWDKSYCKKRRPNKTKLNSIPLFAVLTKTTCTEVGGGVESRVCLSGALGLSEALR